ncbi:hypothetical protein SLS62_011133 [Diatrype stigma]|uniref:NAD(P)-binding domain-containing protein n=1 Tax=Diatrype stigma TaxID=117547 RepID=A0AAN9U5M6_9PEZI
MAPATSSIGGPTLKALLATGKFKVTALVRPGSSHVFPSEVAVKEVNLYSFESVVSALRGQDAVVNETGIMDTAVHTRLIDAAAAAGVYRLIPTEFGMEYDPATTAQLFPVFAYKIQTLAYLKEVTSKKRETPEGEGSSNRLTWTAISTGPFLDWSLDLGFLGVDVKRKRAQLTDGGLVALAQTTLADIGRAVAGALLRAAETENRHVYVRSATKSQSELLALAQDALGGDGEGWEVAAENGREKYEWAMAELARGNFTWDVGMYQIRYAVNEPKYAYAWAVNSRDRDDNALLGLEGGMSDEQIKEMIREIAGRK